MSTQPQKKDTGKLRLELIPPEFLMATARGLGFGAEKYSAGNWATGEGFDHSRLYGGLQRHLNAYWSGEDIDPESGNCHLDHAACMLAFLIAHRERGKGNDDREKIGAAHDRTSGAGRPVPMLRHELAHSLDTSERGGMPSLPVELAFAEGGKTVGRDQAAPPPRRPARLKA